ncbi:MAG TPA: dienelactone hydrolase family protein [Candidatus Limnocylindrales bacterium]
MCFDLDSHPPIAPMAGGSIDQARLILAAGDRNRFAAFRARAEDPTGAAVVILPDVRGLHPYYEELALRFAERGIDALAIDWFGRTAGAEPRGDDFDHMAEVTHTTWAGISGDIVAGVEEIGSPDGDRPAPRAVFTLGFCMGGRMSFMAATLGLPLAGVMGMYGTVVGPWRNDTPAPLDEVGRFSAPVLGIFGGADTATSADAVAAFDAALTGAGVDHRVVTYPDAPHSFFDRKAAEYADASAAAWNEVLAFIEAHTP